MDQNTDKYWCNQGCGWVDENHRCEQWGGVNRIPKEAIESIQTEAAEQARREAATIVDEFLKTYYPEQRKLFGITLCAEILQGTTASDPIADAVKAERERCADVAVNWRRAFGDYHQNDLLRAAILSEYKEGDDE